MLSWGLGLGFGVPGVYGAWFFADHGDVWIFLGFPTYGDGPFESIGIETSTTLLIIFSLVCLAELLAGWLLWRRRRSGAIFALALLPVELAFWIGFALPLGPVLGVALTALIFLGWPALGRAAAHHAMDSRRPPPRRDASFQWTPQPRRYEARSVELPLLARKAALTQPRLGEATR